LEISKIFSILKSQRFLKIGNLKDFQYFKISKIFKDWKSQRFSVYFKIIDFKNTPADASQVRSTANSTLNREETLSVDDMIWK